MHISFHIYIIHMVTDIDVSHLGEIAATREKLDVCEGQGQLV